MQIELQLGRGAGALIATEQAARLARARVERRIGRLLSRRVKLKFPLTRGLVEAPTRNSQLPTSGPTRATWHY
jgi:NADH:ubiquinone oxidoreductase subunit F (NADH-binding)